MSIEENKEIVRSYQDIYNIIILDEVMAAEVRTPKIIPGFPPGLEGAKKVHELSLIGMTDFHAGILYMIAEGDKMVARVNITGVHTGIFWASLQSASMSNSAACPWCTSKTEGS